MSIKQSVTISIGAKSDPATISGSASVIVGASGTFTAATSETGSREGDEAALEALNGTLTGLGTGWSSDMNLSDSIDGVTTDTIGGELRVTEIDLNNKGLTGDIEIDNWENLKELTLFSIYLNDLVSQVPQGLMNLTEYNLEYIYLSRTDNYDEPMPLPHEQAQMGGLDVHPGKNKGDEGNRFTGTVPAPSNPANSILKWFGLDWSDTDFTATDGIQGFEDEFYDIPGFVGLHHYHNNALSRSFPTGLTNMTNMTHLAVTGRNGGSENWFTGSMPAAMSDLVNMQYCRIENCDNLLIDFDIVDLSGWTDLRAVYFSACQLEGTLPDYFYDGSIPNILSIGLSWPQGGTGFTGAHPEVDASMNIKVYQYRNNDLTSLPASLWQNSGSVIQPEFTDNQLTTLGTTDLTQQDQMRYVRLSGNELHENLPYTDWANHDAITGGVEFQNNRYVFKHLLYVPPWDDAYSSLPDPGATTQVSSLPASGSEVGELVYNTTDDTFYKWDGNSWNAMTVVFITSDSTFYRWDDSSETWNAIGQNTLELWQDLSGNDVSYAPQKSFGSLSNESNGVIDFSDIVSHADNEYQWYKDGSPLSGETSNILDTSGHGAGGYHLEVTNPGAPALTLNSTTIDIE